MGFKDEAIRIKTDSESTDGTVRVTADREDMANNDPACGIHLSNKKTFLPHDSQHFDPFGQVRLNITRF